MMAPYLIVHDGASAELLVVKNAPSNGMVAILIGLGDLDCS